MICKTNYQFDEVIKYQNHNDKISAFRQLAEEILRWDEHEYDKNAMEKLQEDICDVINDINCL